MKTVQGAEKVEVVMGRWTPGDLAYIESLDLRSQLGGGATLDLTALFQRRGRSGWPDPNGQLIRVWIHFEGVQRLVLKGFGGGAVQVMGFDIRYIGDRGMETGSFEVEDYEDGVIGFSCNTVELMAAEATGSCL